MDHLRVKKRSLEFPGWRTWTWWPVVVTRLFYWKQISDNQPVANTFVEPAVAREYPYSIGSFDFHRTQMPSLGSNEYQEKVWRALESSWGYRYVFCLYRHAQSFWGNGCLNSCSLRHCGSSRIYLIFLMSSSSSASISKWSIWPRWNGCLFRFGCAKGNLSVFKESPKQAISLEQAGTWPLTCFERVGIELDEHVGVLYLVLHVNESKQTWLQANEKVKCSRCQLSRYLKLQHKHCTA